MADELSFGRYYQPFEYHVEPNAPGYALPLDLSDVVNLTYVKDVLRLDGIDQLLSSNGFVVVDQAIASLDPNRDDIVWPYQYLTDHSIPIFVTVDTWLHLYHVLFDQILEDIEEAYLVDNIKKLTITLFEHMVQAQEDMAGDLKEAARRNAMFLAVAARLLGLDVSIPAFAQQVVDDELGLIHAHEGYAESPLFIYEEDYSQYLPRGHYADDQVLEGYFKAMIWYGRMGLLLKGSIPWGREFDALISPYDAKIQTIQAAMISDALRGLGVEGRSCLEIWQRIYTITASFVGIADDLTPIDYISTMDSILGPSGPEGLQDSQQYLAFKAALALLPSPRIYGGTGNIAIIGPITDQTIDQVLAKTKGMRFMGQRYVPDSYIFQNLVSIQVLDYTGRRIPPPFTYGFDGLTYSRCYPRGLDLMAVLGSKQALQILIEAGDTDYIHYWRQFGQLYDEFAQMEPGQWHRCLYWVWLYTLKALLEDLPQGYPNFMRTGAWQRHWLSSALASWTQLRHDTILYAKPSYTVPRESVPPLPTGFIEPAVGFLCRLKALTAMTREGLSNMQVLSEHWRQRLSSLEGLIDHAIQIAAKQLTGQAILQSDHQFLKGLAASLQQLVVGTGPLAVKTMVVADVHTHALEGQVVEQATGKVDLIVVACSAADGTILAAVGPVLSYYEFKWHITDRLTDRAWRSLLDSEARPDRPVWYRSLMR